MKWLKDRFSALFDNLIWYVIGVTVPVIFTLVINFYIKNTLISLLVLLIFITLVNTLITFIMLRKQNVSQQILTALLLQNQWMLPNTEDENPLSTQARREFEITKKYFDKTSKPQKLIVQFTNRGNNIIQVHEVKYSGYSLGMPSSALSSSYRKVSDGYHLINTTRVEVAPGNDYLVEIGLAQRWQKEDVDRLAGRWGYLRISATYKDQPVEVFNSI